MSKSLVKYLLWLRKPKRTRRYHSRYSSNENLVSSLSHRECWSWHYIQCIIWFLILYASFSLLIKVSESTCMLDLVAAIHASALLCAIHEARDATMIIANA